MLINFSLISKYRTQLMGFSAIWILLYHSFPYNIIFPFSVGYHGVDIFLLLSGFGLYHSLHNKQVEYWTFQKRRIVKLLPLYCLVITSIDFFSNHFFKTIIMDNMMVYYFIPFNVYDIGTSFWYVPATIIFYLTFPFLYKTIESNKNVNKVIVFISFICLFSLMVVVLFSNLIHKINWQFSFIFSRYLFFVIGAYLAKLSLEKRKIFVNKYKLILVALCGVFFILFIKYSIGMTELVRTSSIFIFPFYLVFYSVIIVVIKLSQKVQIINGLFTWTGKRSYEIYLSSGYAVFVPILTKILSLPDLLSRKDILLLNTKEMVLYFVVFMIEPLLIIMVAQIIYCINKVILRFINCVK